MLEAAAAKASQNTVRHLGRQLSTRHIIINYRIVDQKSARNEGNNQIIADSSCN
jgi:hypothetical protein